MKAQCFIYAHKAFRAVPKCHTTEGFGKAMFADKEACK